MSTYILLIHGTPMICESKMEPVEMMVSVATKEWLSGTTRYVDPRFDTMEPMWIRCADVSTVQPIDFDLHRSIWLNDKAQVEQMNDTAVKVYRQMGDVLPQPEDEDA